MRPKTLQTLQAVCAVRRELVAGINTPTATKSDILDVSLRLNTLIASLILSDEEFVDLLNTIVDNDHKEAA